MATLFRNQVIAARRQRLEGSISISQPRSLLLISLLLTGITITAAAFLATGSYARKETVTGYLALEPGVARVRTPRAGVVTGVHVRDGQRVAIRAPLLTINTDTRSGEGVEAGREMLRSINEQLEEIDALISEANSRTGLEQARAQAEVDGLKNELDAIDDRIAIQLELVRNQQKHVERLQAVANAGFISRADLLRRRENMLQSRQLLAGLRQNRSSALSRLKQATLALERLPADGRERASSLRMRRAELEFRAVELSGRRAVTVTAPVGGTVSGLQVAPGSSVADAVSVLSIVPDSDRLEALLLVPTRAVGFVEAGQRVRLRYDAFDYRQFGAQAGIISEISAVPLYPDELHPAVPLREPAYRVSVRLEKRAVIFNGNRFALQPGMLLSADIVLGRRTLLSWILDPVSGIAGPT